MLSSSNTIPGMAGMATGLLESSSNTTTADLPGGGDLSMTDYGQASYDVFDPLNWMLDGIVDFPYNFSSSGGNDGGEMGGMV
jgi:hypothetical protein